MQSTAGLNSVFSFSITDCSNKAKEPNLLYYLSIAGGGENKLIYVFPLGISMKWNSYSPIWNSNFGTPTWIHDNNNYS